MVKSILFALAGLFGVGALFAATSKRAAASVPSYTVPELPLVITPSNPKGLENHNPFNLVYVPIGWRGEVGSDGRFSVFDTDLNGLRAGMINIHTKLQRGQNTIRELISVLSPAFENPTEAYIAFVAKRLNMSPDALLDFHRDIIPLSKAIVRFENGVENAFPDSLYQQALKETGK